MDGGPGVVVQEWISNGTNFMRNQFLNGYDDFRLYPTEFMTQADGLTYFIYHLNTLSSKGEPKSIGDFWAGNDYWVQVDALIYNNRATDSFVIGIDQEGIVQSVESAALRIRMYRQRTFRSWVTSYLWKYGWFLWLNQKLIPELRGSK